MPTTRRKSVAKPKTRSVLSRRSVPVGNDILALGSLPPTDQIITTSTHGRRSTSTKTVTTETVVQHSSLGDIHPRTPPHSPSLADELDPWEILPKTGYTYAQSPSYSERFLNCDNWIIPNMSRPRIRGGAPLSVTSTSSATSSVGDMSSVSQTSAHTWNKHNKRTTDKTEDETIGYKQTLPASVTRSGRSRDGTRRSTRLSGTASKLQSDVSNMSVDEYMQLEKQMEYSGQAGPHKESSRLSLYGLDGADETETSYIRSRRASSSHTKSQIHSSSFYTVITSSMWYLITTLFTVLSTITKPFTYVATQMVQGLAFLAKSPTGLVVQNESETYADVGNCQVEHSTTSTLDQSHSTVNDTIDSSLHGDMSINDRYSDEEIIMETVQTSLSTGKSKYRMKRLSTDEFTEDTATEDTWLMRFFYVLIAMSYVLFIAAPSGIFKALRTSSSWLFAYLLIPIVDGTTSVLCSGYSAVAGGVASLRTILTTTSSVSTTTTSTVTMPAQSMSVSYLSSWYAGAGFYGSKFFSMLSTMIQMLAVIIWTPCHGLWSSLCWHVGVWIHRFASRILLIDVWMLSSSREGRRRTCCCLWPLLILLLFLPFLASVSRCFFAPIIMVPNEDPPLVCNQEVIIPNAGISTVELRKIIAQELLAAKADLKSHDKQLYTDSVAHIQQLEKQIESQGVLLASLQKCCKNDTVLAGIIRSNIQQQLAAIMYGGGSDGSTADGDSSAGAATGEDGSANTGVFSNAAFATWLTSQMADSSDFDAKISALTITLNQQLKEQAEANMVSMSAATKAQNMATTSISEAAQAAGLAASVQEAQDVHTAAWSQDKAHLEMLIAGLTANLKNIDDKASDASATATSANTAAAAAGTAATDASTAAAAVVLLMREQAESQSAAAGLGAGTSTSCGCDSTNVILPDNYQALTEAQVKLLIKEALGIFSADKTGKVDYALESAGGSVISTRCSETYHRRTAQLSLFGIPLWYMSNSPRTAIQPEVQPGQCWAFKGTQGYMVIQLAGFVKITAFSMEHIPKELSPTGKIDSAPKDFSVLGLKYERDTDGLLLGNYTYVDNGESLQYFPVQHSEASAFHVIELRIQSNHGNQEYTCLYRFRVHGVLKKA